MTRITIFSLAALVLLSIGGGSLFIPWGAADTRLAAPLSFIPMQLAGWSGSYAAPPDPLHVDPTVPDQLVRSYRRDTDVVWIAVDYYPWQGDGRRPRVLQASPRGSGWRELSVRPIVIPLGTPAAGRLEANLGVMRNAESTIVILHWYQLGRQSLIGDHRYRAQLLYRRLVHGRADGALVRIVTPLVKGTDLQAAVGTQTDFLRAIYPALLESLPR